MNTHPSAVLLQAFEDGEVGPARRAAVAAHLESCAECRARLEELRSLSRGFAGALAHFDAGGDAALARLATAGPPAPARVAVPTPSDRSWLRAAAIAAILVVGSSVAGLSALWLHDRLQAPEPGPAAVLETAADAPAYGAGFTVAPGAAPLRIDLDGLAADSRVAIRLVDDARVSIDVTAAEAPVRFGDQRAGRIEVSVNGYAEVSIALPRSLTRATIAVDGVVRATRSDGGIEVTPATGGVTVSAEGS